MLRLGLPDRSDTACSPCVSNLEQPQPTSTPTGTVPTARMNRLSISPLNTDPAIDTSANESSVLLESSLEDLSEEQLLDGFLSEGCGCRFAPKDTQCCLLLERSGISKCRQDCLQLENSELDLVVLSCIHSHLSLPNQPTQHVSHHPTGISSPTRSEYFVRGVTVCRDPFLFVHALSHSRYERLIQHYKQVGLCSRMRGNKGRTEHNPIR